MAVKDIVLCRYCSGKGSYVLAGTTIYEHCKTCKGTGRVEFDIDKEEKSFPNTKEVKLEKVGKIRI
ncbi:MAG: hypothetical protein WBP82_02855 [Leuconostoc mesenteroides]